MSTLLAASVGFAAGVAFSLALWLPGRMHSREHLDFWKDRTKFWMDLYFDANSDFRELAAQRDPRRGLRVIAGGGSEPRKEEP